MSYLDTEIVGPVDGDPGRLSVEIETETRPWGLQLWSFKVVHDRSGDGATSFELRYEDGGCVEREHAEIIADQAIDHAIRRLTQLRDERRKRGAA